MYACRKFSQLILLLPPSQKIPLSSIVLTTMPRDRMVLLNCSRLRVRSSEDWTKNASLTLRYSRWLILFWSFSGSQRAPSLRAGSEQRSFLFSWPVGYFFIVDCQLIVMIRTWHSIAGIVTASQLINPYTHEHLPVKPYISEEDLFARISTTTAAFRNWRMRPLNERKQFVDDFVKKVLSEKEQLKPTIAEFTGKSYRNIDEEFRKLERVSQQLIHDSSIAFQKVHSETLEGSHILKKTVIHEPVGLTVIFPYYSEPIFDSLIHLIPCLISGNAAILKVSDYNHFLGAYLNQKWEETSGISGLISDAFIHPAQLKIFREFRQVKKVIFSGSQTSARKIFEELVTNRFIDCNLFYGGKDAAYVDQTADLECAATEICQGAFYNNGQSYDCIKRLYLHNQIADQFLGILAGKISELVLGDPKDSNTDLGPIIIPESVLRFEELINDAINFDAQCIIGGMVTTDGRAKGLFCEPTLLTNCNSSMQIVQEQLQAPILCATTISGIEEFREEVNDNQYGTGVRIFTANPLSYQKILDELEVGFISFNSANIIEGDLPIEGWKCSGKGKILSELTYNEYTVPKSFVIQEEL